MNLIDNIDDYYNPKYSEQEYDDACKYKDKLLEDIDKRFIDREELYKQVKEILDESLTKACLKAMEDKDFIKIYDKNLRKILELLK